MDDYAEFLLSSAAEDKVYSACLLYTSDAADE